MDIAAPEGQDWAEAPAGYRWIGTGRINSKTHLAPFDANTAACGVGVDYSGGQEETALPSPNACARCVTRYHELAPTGDTPT